MKTSTHEFPIMNLSNRVLAVVDDARNATDTVRQLEESGVPEAPVHSFSGDEGLRHIDADGTRGGPFVRIMRAMQNIGVEGEHLRQYDAELRRGRHVIDVPVHPWNRRRVVEILRAHGAHFVNIYGQWAIEPAAA